MRDESSSQKYFKDYCLEINFFVNDYKKSSEFTALTDADHYYTLTAVLYDLSFDLMKEDEKN